MEKWKCVFVLICVTLVAGEIRHFCALGSFLGLLSEFASSSPLLLRSRPAYVSPSLVFKDGVGGEDSHVNMWECG